MTEQQPGTVRRLTLTFDNGPSPRVTPDVLDRLRARGLNAWFCVVGGALRREEGASIVQRALAEGHRIANHSLEHRVPLGDDPTATHAAREIGAMHDLMRETLGNWGAAWFRPFGRGGAIGPHLFSESAVGLLARYGYSVLLWNCVPRDWDDPGGWPATALAAIDTTPHTVLVLHDLPTGAMAALDSFLDAVDARGVVVTPELPGVCVPMREGVPAPGLAALTAAAARLRLRDGSVVRPRDRGDGASPARDTGA